VSKTLYFSVLQGGVRALFVLLAGVFLIAVLQFGPLQPLVHSFGHQRVKLRVEHPAEIAEFSPKVIL
jgi:hypothetical protein